MRTRCLAAQHGELMAKHHDLQLLEILRTAAKQHKLQQAAEHQVPERPHQEQLLEISRTGDRLYG